MKRLVILFVAALCLTLTGCSAAAFFLSGCGSPDADLVVVNGGSREVWSISLDYETETRSVRSARDNALIGQGESYGLTLEEGTEQVTLVLSDRLGRELVRQAVDFDGERLYLTLERDGTLSVSEEWSNGI